jgi:uncharacterized protein
MTNRSHEPLFEVRSSSIHGWGAFAIRRIRKGTRIIEYLGERITHQEADSRYHDDQSEHPHVLLFTVDKKTVIDAGEGGNEARFINHSCEPNCQAITESRRVFIEALRMIAPGEELTYDYRLERPDGDKAEMEQRYACKCGAKTCRGTMLAPLRKRHKSTRGKRTD